MSDLQREILSMVIIFNDETLSSIKPLLEKLLDSELLKIDTNANIKEMDIYDKIDTLKTKEDVIKAIVLSVNSRRYASFTAEHFDFDNQQG